MTPPSEPRHLLVAFVCAGNICRSPMAEVIARSLTPAGTEFISGGLHAVPGTPATNATTLVMAEAGFDLADHRAAHVDELMARDPDLIFVMTARQLRTLIARYPESSGRLQLLDPGGDDIADPYGRDVGIYRSTRAAIAAAVSARVSVWDRLSANP